MDVLLRMRLRALIDPQIRSGRTEIQALYKKADLVVIALAP
jgi:hypothetical protein